MCIIILGSHAEKIMQMYNYNISCEVAPVFESFARSFLSLLVFKLHQFLLPFINFASTKFQLVDKHSDCSVYGMQDV